MSFHRSNAPDWRSNRLAGRSPIGAIEIVAWDVHAVFTDTDWRISSCLDLAHARNALECEVARLVEEGWTVTARSSDLARLYDQVSHGQIRLETRPR